MSFVFDVRMHCDATAVQSMIQRRCITGVKPAICANATVLNLETQTATHTVLNNRGLSCVVKRSIKNEQYEIKIEPENPTANFNLVLFTYYKLRWLVYRKNLYCISTY